MKALRHKENLRVSVPLWQDQKSLRASVSLWQNQKALRASVAKNKKRPHQNGKAFLYLYPCGTQFLLR